MSKKKTFIKDLKISNIFCWDISLYHSNKKKLYEYFLCFFIIFCVILFSWLSVLIFFLPALLHCVFFFFHFMPSKYTLYMNIRCTH
ncbi:uncharacterized protein VTP21DRAFT_4523 [Calcarisporiella thermophila]|uniref:uncharacterized protein n=1 Tax=Calcarisporiella thermophila TaxID=911321 RepID=UPI0037439B2B